MCRSSQHRLPMQRLVALDLICAQHGLTEWTLTAADCEPHSIHSPGHRLLCRIRAGFKTLLLQARSNMLRFAAVAHLLNDVSTLQTGDCIADMKFHLRAQRPSFPPHHLTQGWSFFGLFHCCWASSSLSSGPFWMMCLC